MARATRLGLTILTEARRRRRWTRFATEIIGIAGSQGVAARFWGGREDIRLDTFQALCSNF